MPDIAPDMEEYVRETIAAECKLVDALIVTDDDVALRGHHEAGRMPKARLVVVEDPQAPLTDVEPLVLEFARAGKTIRTWCSLTEDGRRIASEAAQTLNPHLPDGDRVLHITDPPPHAWLPPVDSFENLVKGARGKLPPAAQKEQSARRARKQGGASPQFDTDPESIARRIILTFGGELLIVAPAIHDRKGFSTGFALDEDGVWSDSGDTWARWLVKISNDMRFEAWNAGLEEKAVGPTLAAISRIKNPRMIEPVQKMLGAALRVLREEGDRCLDVTTCRAEELDADMRYLGVANGVVNLHTGELVPPEQARGHLVTLRCPVEYHRSAMHPALDKLFAAWSPVLMTWWRGVLGYALRGLPKRLYFAVGPPDSGKSTLGTALSKVLGRYMRTAAPDVLQKRTRSSETQLTPGLRVWHRPTRIVWINEIKETAINERLTNDLAGGGDRLAARGLHEGLVEEDVTATTFATCNPESIPHLKLTNSGMRSRYRELQYPKATTLDPELKPTLCGDPGAQRALLAWIVAAAVATPVEPDDVPEVQAATTARIRDDAGEIGEFARRIVRGDVVLAVPQVWQEWCIHNGEKEDAKEPGGIGKRRLSRALSDHVPGLGRPKQITVDGHNVRGWRGWRLLTVEEAERAATKPLPYVPSPEAEQAIQDLLAGFPDDFSIFDRPVAHRWLQTRPVAELLALHRVCKNGRILAEQIKHFTEQTSYTDITTGQMFDTEGFLKDVMPELGDEERVQEQLRRAVSHLAWEARYGHLEWTLSKQATHRPEDLKWDIGFIARDTVEAAVQALGPEALDEAKVRGLKAVIDHLNSISGEEEIGKSESKNEFTRYVHVPD